MSYSVCSYSSGTQPLSRAPHIPGSGFLDTDVDTRARFSCEIVSENFHRNTHSYSVNGNVISWYFSEIFLFKNENSYYFLYLNFYTHIDMKRYAMSSPRLHSILCFHWCICFCICLQSLSWKWSSSHLGCGSFGQRNNPGILVNSSH